jgi:hypothetical protein
LYARETGFVLAKEPCITDGDGYADGHGTPLYIKPPLPPGVVYPTRKGRPFNCQGGVCCEVFCLGGQPSPCL